MKQMKKLLSVALAFCLLLALALPVLAAPVTVGGQTVELPGRPGSTPADLTGHTFTAYQIFSASYAKDEKGQDTTDIVGIHWGDAVDGATVLAALQADEAFGAGEANVFSEIAYEGDKGPEDFDNAGIDPVAYAVAKEISEFDDTQARAFAELVDSYITADTTAAGTKGYGAGDTLPAGYYLVVDTTAVDGQEGQVRNLSVLSMGHDAPFNPTTKADVPELEKKVLEVNDSDPAAPTVNDWKDAADYDIGDAVPFVLTGTLPTNYADYDTYKYIFHDTLSDGLTFSDDIEVYIDGVKVETGFAVDTNPAGGESFTVTFEDLKTNTAVTAGSVIQVVYTATLNDRAAIGGTGNTNTAHLEYSNNPNNGGEGDTGNTPDDVVTVFTFTLIVNKKDEEKNALGGAEFTLSKLSFDENGAETWVDVDRLVVSGEKNDIFTFKGLDAGKYRLVESKVPSGYNKAEDMYFTITATEELVDGAMKVTELKVESVNDANGNQLVDSKGEALFTINAGKTEGGAFTGSLTTDIVNMSGLQLPSTGGIGTTIFYVVGGALIVGAGVLLIAKKRMGKEN